MVFGEVSMTNNVARHFDVAVIGGGAAGLSAAVALGRARRAVIVLDDGSPRNAPARVLGSLGFRPVPHPAGAAVGEHIESDPAGLTPVPGVWVAGNVTDIQAQVITAAAQGLAAAAAVNADLIAEETRRAVDASRAHRLARDPEGSAQRAG
jgi:thioredoxin reductase